MKQSDAVQFLYRDLGAVRSHLILPNYDRVFEQEMREYFPFSQAALDLLTELYRSEKYGAFDEDKLCLYFEKEHPFLFMRDLAYMNSWNAGHRRKDRQDHITGLMFSENSTYALEATLCLCRPSLIKEGSSQWFDFKQAMGNLELASMQDFSQQAWKASALFYLYFFLSPNGESISREELSELMEPYQETLSIAMHEGSLSLKAEVATILRTLQGPVGATMLDGIRQSSLD